MKIIHGGGFSHDDKKSFKQLIYKNIFMAIQSLLRAMRVFNLVFDSKRAQVVNLLYDSHALHTYFCLILKEMAGLIDCYEHYDISIMEPEYVEAIQILWDDERVQECFGRRREYHLIDSAK